MFDIKILREDFERAEAGLRRRGKKDVGLEAFKELDQRRRKLLFEMEQMKAQQNKASEEVAQKKRAGEDAAEIIEAMKGIKTRIGEMEELVRMADGEMEEVLLGLPNLPDASVPDGSDETANRLERTWGEKPEFDFEPLGHVALGEKLGILDFERASKITGARFCLSVGAAARMERALTSFMLDVHTREHGYTEVLPPFIVNSNSMLGTGQLPKFGEDLFKLEGTDYWLIPTAEVPVTNIHRDEILADSELPKYYTAYTPCFRSEAGSYGKDTRGMIRQHQFNKVELVKFVRPEESFVELEKLTQDAERILQLLGLHYRVMVLCAGDMGFGSTKTYDLEVWLPSQNAYREISSCSNYGDFQGRRANIRFKRDKKPEFVHTLNGSGLAVGRTLVAILENYQNADGSVRIPDALQDYMGGVQVIEAGQ